MQKLMTRKPEKKTREPVSSDYIVIDHPKNNETINSRHYTVRIGASECASVEISIDDHPWHPCRPAVGYWWYDWHGFSAGSHQVVARMLKTNGEFLISKRRRVKVI